MSNALTPAADAAARPEGLKSDQLFINLGPQHPSTHGVLRIGLTINGEVIVKAVPDIGYLHRGTEKLAELRNYHHCVVLTDRWDYVAAMPNNLVFCLAAEKLMGVKATPRADALRVIMCEMNRIASHLLFFGTYGIDLGALTPFLYAFREREMVLDLFEMLCGARLTYNYIRLGGVMTDVSPEWLKRTTEFVEYFKPRLDEYDTLLTYNPIFMARTQGVGIVTPEEAVGWALSGPNLRGSGVNHDVRKSDPYSGYENYEFDVPLGKTGSCWDRYFCRVQEMRQSLRIIEQAIANLPAGPFMAPGVAKIPKPAAGEAYAHVEGARGDLGIYVASDGGISPFRMHVHAPSFINLAMLQEKLVGMKVSDVIALLGSIDIVLGEVDR
ncbi:MAG: NADH-quinone oxidoreductase subunit D [Elusimicrobia bacterium]|nr:NADH-quinone oxidoreductase subunit D [Elusimicrobiota bacterium]